MEHRIPNDLIRSDFKVTPNTEPQGYIKGAPTDTSKSRGHLMAFCHGGAPADAVTGFSKGCMCIRIDGTIDAMWYINVGDENSATWTATRLTPG